MAKFKYSADITVPKPLRALMSANPAGEQDNGDTTTYSFRLDVWCLTFAWHSTAVAACA